MTKREAILKALEALLLSRPDLFPTPTIDEPEPTGWEPVAGNARLQHAIMVMDGGPPDQLAFVRGAEDEATDELELEAAIGYAVQARTAPGETVAQTRAARRAQRDATVRAVADLIAADGTLGLSVETYADVLPVTRDDDVAYPDGLPAATAIIPIRVLYTGADAAA